MPERYELKQSAKEQMRGSLGTLILCTLIASAVNYALSWISSASSFRNAYEILLQIPQAGAANFPYQLPHTNANFWLVTLAALFVLGPLTLNTCLIYINLRAGQRPAVKDLFTGYGRKLLPAFLLNILTSVFVFLWSLLLIVPGIIKGISYSMAPYILVENPDMTPLDAIRASKSLTHKYKFDIFVLQLSFIPWALLSALTFGILNIVWLTPYVNATFANFYEELKRVKGGVRGEYSL